MYFKVAEIPPSSGSSSFWEDCDIYSRVPFTDGNMGSGRSCYASLFFPHQQLIIGTFGRSGYCHAEFKVIVTCRL